MEGRHVENGTKRTTGRRLGALLTTGALVLGAGVVGTDAARGADGEVYTQTFTADEDGSSQAATFTVPADATSVHVTVAGQQGQGTTSTDNSAGGAGGIATVDLGTAYNGETLDLLVGRDDDREAGAGAAFVAFDDEFLVVAGAGGQGGDLVAEELVAWPGGDGGFANGSPNGGDGAPGPYDAPYGKGAVGASYGAAAENVTTGEPGSVATVVDGVITPGRPATGNGFTSPQGGQGYAGGGGAAAVFTPALRGIVRGACGGGSGFLADGLELLSTGANHSGAERAAAYITFTWTLAADEEPGTEEPGADEPGTDGPGTDEPSTDEPSTDEPGVDEPGTDDPAEVSDVVLPVVAG